MHSIRWAACFCLLTLCAATAAAQSTNGTISGRVVDAQGLSVPGVTVTLASPNLQGLRTAVTSENGDWVATLLPPGRYVVSFELAGFQREDRTVALAPTQVLPLNVTLGLSALTESVRVEGRSADVLTQTAQVATNFSQELMRRLPTPGDLNATLLLAPTVHPTGPQGNFSIAGAVSFENLFLLNGVTINENVRGSAYDLYIEDAIQETTVATGGVSAEFGRFSGGMVNVITKSGGNAFSGSFRDTLNDDKWRTLTPFEDQAIAAGGREPRVKNVIPTYEYTVGGPVMRDRLWFFTAGRLQKQESGRTLVISQIPYTFTEDNRRFEFKGTYAADSNHRFQSAYTRVHRAQENYTFNVNLSMDLDSLGTRKLPEELFTATYTGVLSQSFFVETRISNRKQSFIGNGARSTDLIDGTLLIDRSRGNTRYWSDTFCGVCDPEQRDNSDVFVKGSYFLSSPNYGSHTLGFGYDIFNDKRQANNHQSGSDYRILGTSTVLAGTGDATVIYPQFLGDGSTIIQWNPIPLESQGSNFRTHSAFFNDNWRISGNLTANLGIRWDKNDGTDQAGTVVARDSAFSPRLGLVWDPSGDGRWSVTGSVAKYTASISNPIADTGSAGGNPQSRQFIYRGASINPAGVAVLTPTPQSVQAVFDWFFANGGANLALNGPATIPGVTPVIGESLSSPHSWELATGVSRQFGSRAALRADFTYRDYGNLYLQHADMSTGRVTDLEGRSYDLTRIENDVNSLLSRQYAGLALQATYRLQAVEVGGNYTVSRAWGNVDGETVNGGPSSFDYRYPEYKQAAWNFPEGGLSVDQRHRSRLWVTYNPSWVTGLAVSLLQNLESGVPYAAVTTSGVDPRNSVTNPGYLTPPSGTQTTYYFGPRDEFHTAAHYRTDLGVSYNRRIPGAGRAELFGQMQILNLFNQFQLCGCGASTFGTGSSRNGGGVDNTRIDQTVQTAVTTPARFQPFNPFTTTPVRGVNWDYGPLFGQALNRFAYTTPLSMRLTFGVRF